MELIIHTDAIALANPGKCAFGAILVYGSHTKMVSGVEAHLSVHAGKSAAVLLGLNSLNEKAVNPIFYTNQLPLVQGIMNPSNSNYQILRELLDSVGGTIEYRAKDEKNEHVKKLLDHLQEVLNQ